MGKNFYLKNNENYNINFKRFYLHELIKNYDDKYQYFNITDFHYSFSFKFNIVKVEYNIGFFDKTNNLIFPSDMTLYNNLNIICNSSIDNYDNNIQSLANIYKNKFFSCIEFININDKLKFGISINKKLYNESYTIYLIDNKIINYNNLYNSNCEFEQFIINQKHLSLISKIKNDTNLKKLYIKQPKFCSKTKAIVDSNNWEFINIYNNYFCSCRGSECTYQNISKHCKFYFYLYIIDNNKNLYNKTDYLFGDFIFAKFSSDDAYPIFEEMIKLNLSAHYITEDINIYNKYCQNKTKCLSIILVNRNNRRINGDFLEKYLTLFLKLKAAISGAEFLVLENLLFNIEYITHICIGHGISIFKQFLYSSYGYYGFKKYNKILLPPSKTIISIAIKKGWKDENIIKINYPKWDKYFNKNISFINGKIKKQSIFVMFTWRGLKKTGKISDFYIINIFKLLKNKNLIKALNKNDITLYFAVHHNAKHLIKKFKVSKPIQYIKEKHIFECLSKTNLVVTDFSSIIFDMICRKKPYIIFIPDANDPNITNNYDKYYYNTIKSFKNDSLNILNKYFELDDAVKKIIYYINNDFKLEKKMLEFYKSFSFEGKNNTKQFIEYLIKLK